MIRSDEVWDVHPEYGPLKSQGAELYKFGFLLIQSYAYREFTNHKQNIPKRVRMDWNKERLSFIITPADVDDEDSLAFTDESVQPTNPKPRGRIRIKSTFKASRIPWPEFALSRAAMRIPYQVTPGKLELFLGIAYEVLGESLVVEEGRASLEVGNDLWNIGH